MDCIELTKWLHYTRTNMDMSVESSVGTASCRSDAAANPRFRQWSQSHCMIPVHTACLLRMALHIEQIATFIPLRQVGFESQELSLLPAKASYLVRIVTQSWWLALPIAGCMARQFHVLPGTEAGSLCYPDQPRLCFDGFTRVW